MGPVAEVRTVKPRRLLPTRGRAVSWPQRWEGDDDSEEAGGARSIIQ
jgi:hypothetical protein